MLFISQPIGRWLRPSRPKQVGKHDASPSCFNDFIRAARGLEFYPPALPGSCHGAVPSQHPTPLAGAAPGDYEKHYIVS